MSDTSALTILDVVYAVLEGSDRPLTPYEIEAVALGAGYDLRAWEAADEIEAHLDSYGQESPFIQVGRQKYWLYPEAADGDQLMVSPSIFHRVMGAMVILMIAALIWLSISSTAIFKTTEIAASQPVEAAPVPAQDLSPDQSSIQASPIAIDSAWWSANAVNQINQDTQSVSRSFLSNYYNTCGPAVLSMVVTFYRSQLGDGSRLTPADVLRDARSQLGYFIPPYNSGLLDFNSMNALANLYGLTRANPEGRGYLLSTEELLQGVRQGTPAIVGMRYGYDGGGQYLPVGGSGLYNHFVIVFGTQQVDGQEYLLVLNNHPGKYLVDDTDVQPELMGLEQFQQSWLFNDGSEDHNYGAAAFFKPAT